MGHRSTRKSVEDLRQNGRLIEIEQPISPHLEMAEIQRRVYLNDGPAVLFSNPIGCKFPMVSNLFGSIEQARFLFRETIERVRRAIELKIDPAAFFQQPTRYLSAPWVAWTMAPKRVKKSAVQYRQIELHELPQLKSWPEDGGAFVTLPQVLSQSPVSKTKSQNSLAGCNLGMYRVQISGNEYSPENEIGLHYQIHRGIGVHHRQAIEQGGDFPVCVSVGGSPAMSVAAVMPLPEGLSELTFAGALAGHRIPMVTGPDHAPIYGDADFCIVGNVEPNKMKPEGPFGDHLGYYSLQHEFPLVKVKKVYARKDAIWPFTVVGRPPQEDTTFGDLIHELTGPIIPTVIPGVKEVNAVDAAGVHPLLLALGSERYLPYRKPDKPSELLTQANAILGQGQMSLAKYLWIANSGDDSKLSVNKIHDFFAHCLRRVDWRRDLHFQTRTTIDTLDYSGSGFNSGSKVVIAVNGEPIRELSASKPEAMELPGCVSCLTIPIPGILAIEMPDRAAPDSIAEANRAFQPNIDIDEHRKSILSALEHFAFSGPDPQSDYLREFPLIVLTEDARFVAKNLNNWLWATFTRSDPAADIFGLRSWSKNKHWGCDSSVVIDIRRKEHHAPPLVEDPNVTAKIDAMAAANHPISRYL